MNGCNKTIARAFLKEETSGHEITLKLKDVKKKKNLELICRFFHSGFSFVQGNFSRNERTKNTAVYYSNNNNNKIDALHYTLKHRSRRLFRKVVYLARASHGNNTAWGFRRGGEADLGVEVLK